jgi:hypothetical protein
MDEEEKLVKLIEWTQSGIYQWLATCLSAAIALTGIYISYGSKPCFEIETQQINLEIIDKFIIMEFLFIIIIFAFERIFAHLGDINHWREKLIIKYEWPSIPSSKSCISKFMNWLSLIFSNNASTNKLLKPILLSIIFLIGTLFLFFINIH